MALPLYVTVPELKSSIQIPDSAADADIQRALGAASRAVEKATSRRFWLDEEESGEEAGGVTHKYTALSNSLVVVDDVTTIMSVRVNGTELDEGSWYPEPANNPTRGEPYLWIESDGKFTLGRQAIEVEGLFGWPEVPDQVKQIVMVVANKLLKRTREAPWGIIATGFDGLALRITRDDPDVAFLVEPLTRAETRRR